MPKPDQINLFATKPEDGVLASAVDDIANIVDVARQIGKWLKHLHSLDQAQIPFPIETEVIELDEQVAVAVTEQRNEQKLAAPYDRFTASELCSKLVQISPAQVCPTHGAPRLCDFTVSEAGVVSHFEVAESIGLRRPVWDLASLQSDITRLYGAGAVFEFYEGYESDPSLVDLDSAFGFIAVAEAINVV